MPRKDPEARRAYEREKFQRNKERILAQHREYQLANPEKIKEQRAAKYRRHVTEIKRKASEYSRKNAAAVRERMFAYVRSDAFKEKRKERHAQRYASEPQYRISLTVRNRIREILTARGLQSASAIKYAGCTAAELVKHLESLFQAGMSWENYGEWHIDHIRPLAAFDVRDAEQLKQACHFTNLQPLWAIDNMRKGARIAEPKKSTYTEVAQQSEQRLTEARTDSAMTGFVMEKPLHVCTFSASST